MRQCLTVFFSGRVQGVGFRYTVKTLSHGYELTGIVRNLSDGRVELVVEGERQELKDFLQAVCDSEVAPFIKQVESKWDNAANQFRGFEIAR